MITSNFFKVFRPFTIRIRPKGSYYLITEGGSIRTEATWKGSKGYGKIVDVIGCVVGWALRGDKSRGKAGPVEEWTKLRGNWEVERECRRTENDGW